MMDRFKFEFPDLRIDLDQGLLELLHASRGSIQSGIECVKGRVGLIPHQESAGDLVDDLLAEFSGDVLHPLKQRRRLPVEPNDLDLAVDAFRNREDGLIEGATSN